MIERVVTAGIFSLDGEDFEVENNIWIVGDEHEVMVVDAAHDHRPIVDAVGGRAVAAIVATHGHNDHINAAGALADALGAPVWLHPDDLMLWADVHPDRRPDGLLADGMTLAAGGVTLEVLHTPGHSPGGVCLHERSGRVVFSGDTLFHGGPGATGRSFSDLPTLLASIRSRLLVLPGETRVLTGHGDETTIGAEAAGLAGAR
jgi:glyoxylase-like metal-dependent hydrolase (beta-lactamase superfamily II)